MSIHDANLNTMKPHATPRPTRIRRLRLAAPAKLNLYLRVLGRRPGGYHNLETIFEQVDLADELTLEPDPAELSLTVSIDPASASGPGDAGVPTGEENLILRAARLLQGACGVRAGARIHLLKRIPVAAGLGGGSSDAAAALRGLTTLWNLRLPQEALMRLGGALGADVPFFLLGRPYAIGQGRGDRCTPLQVSVRMTHVLVVPQERLLTREVYAASRFDLTAPKPSLRIVEHALRNGSLGELASGLWNDLEPEAIRRCPIIGAIQSRLRECGCPGARMSGSGTAVFGLCRDLPHAKHIVSELRADQVPRRWRIEIIQTRSRST